MIGNSRKYKELTEQAGYSNTKDDKKIINKYDKDGNIKSNLAIYCEEHNEPLLVSKVGKFLQDTWLGYGSSGGQGGEGGDAYPESTLKFIKQLIKLFKDTKLSTKDYQKILKDIKSFDK